MSRNIHVRLIECERDFRVGNFNNALLQHISQSDPDFNFISVKMLVYIYNKRLFEAGAISFCNSLNPHLGFYNISPFFSKLILNSYNIFHL